MVLPPEILTRHRRRFYEQHCVERVGRHEVRRDSKGLIRAEPSKDQHFKRALLAKGLRSEPGFMPPMPAIRNLGMLQ